MTALKYDDGKPRITLIHPAFLRAMAKVLTFGALKYDAWNWLKGMEWSRPADSLHRHFLAWQEHESIDAESGCHHLAQVAVNAMFLFTYETFGLGTDDRPTTPKTETVSCAECSGELSLTPISCVCKPDYGKFDGDHDESA